MCLTYYWNFQNKYLGTQCLQFHCVDIFAMHILCCDKKYPIPSKTVCGISYSMAYVFNKSYFSIK